METFNDPHLGASLDNPSLADRVINLSRELAVANDALKKATERSDTWRIRSQHRADRIDNASTLIKDAIINDDVDIDTLKSIAHELNIELTRDVRIKMTITASGTATVPIDFDLDDIDGEISVNFSNNYGTDTELDIEVDDMTVDCEEI